MPVSELVPNSIFLILGAGNELPEPGLTHRIAECPVFRKMADNEPYRDTRLYPLRLSIREHLIFDEVWVVEADSVRQEEYGGLILPTVNSGIKVVEHCRLIGQVMVDATLNDELIKNDRLHLRICNRLILLCDR